MSTNTYYFVSYRTSIHSSIEGWFSLLSYKICLERLTYNDNFRFKWVHLFTPKYAKVSNFKKWSIIFLQNKIDKGDDFFFNQSKHLKSLLLII